MHVDPPQTGSVAGPVTDSTALRTPAEHATLGVATHYAAVEGFGVPPEAAYLAVLPGARREILHRLVAALLRESISGLARPRVVDGVADLAGTLPADAAGRAEELAAAVQSVPGWRRLAALSLPDAGETLVVPLAAVHGYDRFRPTGPAFVVAAGGVEPVDHPVDVVPLLDRAGLFARPALGESFEAELAESVANLALARLSPPAQWRPDRVDRRDGPDPTADGRTAREPTARSAGPDEEGAGAGVSEADGEVVAGSLPGHLATLAGGADLEAALERLPAVEERPTHPSAKIRRGAEPADALVYAPEFVDAVQLRFVAVAADATLQSRGSDEERLTELLAGAFPGLASALEDAVPPDRDPAEYVVLPVHPWQFYHLLPERFAAELADGRVLVLPYTRPATPLLNFRTVVPFADGAGDGVAGPHLKLPVGLQKTNHLRTLPVEEVSNGPRASELVARVVRDAGLDRLDVLRDRAAACYLPGDAATGDEKADDEGAHLGALLRENPTEHPLVPPDGAALVAASLLAPSPATGRPLVCTLVSRLAAATGDSPREAARRFLAAYLAALIPAQVRLTCKYGVALSSHLQNTVVALDADGLPVAVLVRDFGDIRVLPERLETQGFELPVFPGSDIDAGSVAELDRKTINTVYQLNVAEVVATLAEHTELDEATCWELVRSATREELDALRADPAVPDEWVDRDEAALFADRVPHGSRLAMRFQGLIAKPFDPECVANPLAAWPPATDDQSGRPDDHSAEGASGDGAIDAAADHAGDGTGDAREDGDQ